MERRRLTSKTACKEWKEGNMRNDRLVQGKVGIYSILCSILSYLGVLLNLNSLRNVQYWKAFLIPSLQQKKTFSDVTFRNYLLNNCSLNVFVSSTHSHIKEKWLVTAEKEDFMSHELIL